MQYTQDYDEHLPSGYLTDTGVPYPDGKPRTYQSWRVAIFPYVKSVQVFNCPSAASILEWKGEYKITQAAYAYNWRMPTGTGITNVGVHMGNSNTAGASLAAIEDVAGTIFVTEGSSALTRFNTNFFPTEANLTSSGACVESTNYSESICLRAPHMDTMNTLFVDGHVKAMQWKTILGSKTDIIAFPIKIVRIF